MKIIYFVKVTSLIKPQKYTLFPKSNMTLLDLNAFYGHFRKLENMTKEWTWHNNYSPIISPLTFRVKRADKKLEWNKFIADGKMKTHNLTQMYPNLGIGARDWPAMVKKHKSRRTKVTLAPIPAWTGVISTVLLGVDILMRNWFEWKLCK